MLVQKLDPGRILKDGVGFKIILPGIGHYGLGDDFSSIDARIDIMQGYAKKMRFFVENGPISAMNATVFWRNANV